MKHGLSERKCAHRAPIADRRDSRAFLFCQRCGFPQRVALYDFITGDDDRTLCPENARCQRLQRLVGGLYARIDAGRTAQFNAGFRIQNIARQRDEHRPGRRRGRDLGGAAHDPRQVLEPRHLDRPFYQRFGHPDQRPHRAAAPSGRVLAPAGRPSGSSACP